MSLHKDLITFSFLLVGINPWLPVNVMAEDLSAEKIIARSWQLYRQASTEKESIEVESIQNQGRRESKSLTRWTKFDPSGEDKVAVVFSKPVMDDGLGLLTWRHPDKEDDQWLKLPSMDKVRRVSVSDYDKYFAGTDFTYEDLRQLSGELGGDTMVLWWALALGACLGGNGTAVGASANVTVTGMAERAGEPITFNSFARFGVPLAAVTVADDPLVLRLALPDLGWSNST